MALDSHGQAARTIVYANVDGERVQRAFGSLHAALMKAGVLARHRVELRHVIVDEHDPERLQADLEKIVAMRPAAIVAPGGVIAAAAQKATVANRIPVVFGTWASPVHSGLVESLARPGANLTGSTDFMPLEEKRLELLLEVAPGTRRLGVLVDHLWMRQSHVATTLEAAARSRGLTVRMFAAESEADVDAVMASEDARAVHAWYVPFIEVLFMKPDFVVDAFRRLGKPVMYTRSAFVSKGGLISYQSELGDVFEVWAKLLGQILDGVPPAIIPIERPRHFELAVNLETARRLELTIPRSILKRADRFY